MLAEVVDAVIGGDTHRDTHALEMTAPTGVSIATLSVSNDERGFADALAWIAEHAPGPRVVVALEGTAATGSGCPEPYKQPDSAWWRSNVRAAPSVGAASPTRSTPTWPHCTRCAWTPTGCPRPEPTATGRRCAFCSALAGN
jgi:hypothetical protein